MLYGRHRERAVIGALLEGARQSRSGALVVRGEAGVGKTALLDDTRDRAADMQVLASIGVESEAELPFAGLHQLVRPALDLLDRLPEPQAIAIQGALGLTDRGENERFLVSAACLTLLSELAERRPVLCLIDDAQWLDTPSADALLFVARRLGPEGIVMMFGAREGDERRFEARGIDELVLGGLDNAAADELVARVGGRTMPAAVRDALVRQAGGIALALVELPAALTPAQLAGNEPLPETLPLTREVVERLFSARIRRLPEAAQQALLVVAADDSGALGPVSRASEELGLGADALTPAEHAGLVTVHGSRIEMRHPLVRSAVYHGAPSSARRAVHLALAGAFDGDLDLDQRAWHRAAASVGPDEDIAADLEQTAERARLRSGYAAAAAALHRAAELSVDAESRSRRLVAAATAAWEAGQPDRARILLDRAQLDGLDPALRAQAAHVRGEIEWRGGVLVDAAETLMKGAEEIASINPGKAFDMLFDACFVGFNMGDRELSAEAGRRASHLPRPGDAVEALRADLLVGVSGLALGDASELTRLRHALARVDELDDARSLVMAAVGFTGLGDDAMRSAVLRRADALARTSGAVDVLSTLLVNVANTGIFTGQFGVAAGAEEGLELAREAGLDNAATLNLAVLAWLDGVYGREDDCRAKADQVMEATRLNGLALAHSLAGWGVAMLDLSIGRADDAMTRLLTLASAPVGVGQPYIVLNSAADLVEAAVRAGRNDEARAAPERLEQFAQRNGAPWALGLSARCRALLAETEDAAEAAFAEAIELHDRSNRRFDRARTELLYGEHLRRRRRRIEAREHLRAALEVFDAVGAAAWAERARTELRASGESARKRDPSTSAELTPQELQVARFVAEGLSNKEVAAQLFLSPRTIDAHLRNVFAKLGITSRTQLAHVRLEAEGPFAEEAAPAVA